MISLAAALGVALAAATPTQSGAPGIPCGQPSAEILSPKDGAEVPRDGQDPACDRPGFCIWITVVGRISDCYWPFIGVTPHETKPLFWIQPRITRVDRTSGRFSLDVRLGNGRDGLNEKFDIFVIGARRQNRFFDDQSLFGLPAECQGKPGKEVAPPCFASDVVTVRRVR